ncbi:MaoC family dehydratase N-terminal domain-containing protein [Rhizobium sp. AN80A]|uniref:FAS1-like dehydratase domain-containing protein n=1 Tax=Rhizobium sp. AN80A TaxID=3040673 RepID=UPI0024B3950E|nr:MaoC family dehydratase N-terminal domain-containing protein [Rhizobium sp. AN80A]
MSQAAESLVGTNYITEEITALIGVSGPVKEAPHPVEASEVRRFFQAISDFSPKYTDPEWAKESRYGGLVAPLAFPALYIIRRGPTEPDPLEVSGASDFDGVQRSLRPGLPPVNIPLPRLLNGGYEYEFHSNARVGDRIFCRASYKDIYQRDGKNGPMVFILIQEDYFTQDDRPLYTAVSTNILR